MSLFVYPRHLYPRLSSNCHKPKVQQRYMHGGADPEPAPDIGVFGFVPKPEHRDPGTEKAAGQRQQIKRSLRHPPLFALGAKLVEAIIEKGDKAQRQEPRRVEGQGRVLKDPKAQRCHQYKEDEMDDGLHV